MERKEKKANNRIRWILMLIAVALIVGMFSTLWYSRQETLTVMKNIQASQQLDPADIATWFSTFSALETDRRQLIHCNSTQLPQLSFSRCPALLRQIDQQLHALRQFDLLRSAEATPYFLPGSAVLTPEAQRQLEKMLPLFRKHTNTRFLIVGHTDGTGEARQNTALSEQRAINLRDWLLKHLPATNQQFEVRGEGANQPIGNNASAEGRTLNRRAEIFLIPDQF